MEFQTIDAETNVKIDGLWHTEFGALAAALAELGDAARDQSFAASNVALADILTTPGHPDAGPFLRPLVLDRLALPADIDDATILASAAAAVPAAADRIAAAMLALHELKEALIAYATERREQAVAQRQFHEPQLIPVFARAVEVARQTMDHGAGHKAGRRAGPGAGARVPASRDCLAGVPGCERGPAIGLGCRKSLARRCRGGGSIDGIPSFLASQGSEFDSHPHLFIGADIGQTDPKKPP